MMARGTKDDHWGARWVQLTPAGRDAQHRAMRALWLMRNDHLSMTAAARAAGTTPRTVRRYAAPALIKTNREYRAKPSDSLYRRMAVYGPDGRVDVDVRGSKEAGTVARHFNAVGRFLATGNESELDPFRGQTIGGVELLTDADRIEELAARRDLDIDDIYPTK